VPALTDQVQVQLTDRRQPPVRVVDLDRRPAVVGHQQPVVAGRLRQFALEERVGDAGQLDLLVTPRHRHRGRAGPQGPRDHLVADGVHTQHRMRVVVRT
jgi:hypothetical protein